MFDIGFWEISLIAVISLLILGPERLPRVARTAGLWIRRAKRMVADVKSNIDEELRMEELKELQSAGEDLKQGLSKTEQQLNAAATEFQDTVESETLETPPADAGAASDTQQLDAEEEKVDLVAAMSEASPELPAATTEQAPVKSKKKTARKKKAAKAGKKVTRKSAGNATKKKARKTKKATGGSVDTADPEANSQATEGGDQAPAGDLPNQGI